MITAEAARSITNSSIANARDSLLFNDAVKHVEKLIKDAASRGERHCSGNVKELGWVTIKLSVNQIVALANEFRKNGFSWREFRKDDWSVWFEVSW